MPTEFDRRPDPDLLLKQLDAQDEQLQHERLKVFLGYASGVGKSFRMLDEGRRRRARGQDVVIGAIQKDLPAELAHLLETMEVIPLKKIGDGEAMDVEAILRRRPQVCLVDGVAYNNPPGAKNAQRWQDVEELLAAGIIVITSLNLQHIEERRKAVERITGKRATDTVPERFLYNANEIVIVDVPPELLLERAGQPSSTPTAAADTPRRLSALREIALLLAAEVVDRQLEDYLLAHGIEQLWGTQERILVYMTRGANAHAMIASGRRNVDRFHGELFAVYIRDDRHSEKDEGRLQELLKEAEQIGAQTAALDGYDPIEALMDFARTHRITQIFVGHPSRVHWWDRFLGGPLDRLIRAAEGIDVRVFPH
ncbi:MAG: sensor histidine kinase KdpD [Terriglobia bacterium]|jgi:two-component system, OmpR family, sensor histidine kinase KdpD